MYIINYLKYSVYIRPLKQIEKTKLIHHRLVHLPYGCFCSILISYIYNVRSFYLNILPFLRYRTGDTKN